MCQSRGRSCDTALFPDLAFERKSLKLKVSAGAAPSGQLAVACVAQLAVAVAALLENAAAVLEADAAARARHFLHSRTICLRSCS